MVRFMLLSLLSFPWVSSCFFQDEEFRYLTAKQDESGRALSLEVCPSRAGPSETPPSSNRSVTKQQHRQQLGVHAGLLGAAGAPVPSEGRRAPLRRRAAAPAGEAAATAGTPHLPAGRSTSRSTSQTAHPVPRLQSCALAPSPLQWNRRAAAERPPGAFQIRDQGTPSASQACPSNPRRSSCVSQASLRAPKKSAPASGSPTAKKRVSRDAIASPLSSSNGPSSSGGPRGPTCRQRLRASAAAAQQQTSSRKPSQARGLSGVPGRGTTQARTRPGPRANTQVYGSL